MKKLLVLLIVLSALTTQAQTTPPKAKTVYAKVTKCEVHKTSELGTTYKVTTDKGITYYTTTNTKIGTKIKIYQ